MTRQQAALNSKKSKSPSFQRKLDRVAQKKADEARAQAYAIYALDGAVKRKLFAFTPDDARIALVYGDDICPVSFKRVNGGFIVHVEHERVEGRGMMLFNWLAGKREVTLRRGATEMLVSV
jgi:hypothetical protein